MMIHATNTTTATTTTPALPPVHLSTNLSIRPIIVARCISPDQGYKYPLVFWRTFFFLSSHYLLAFLHSVRMGE